MLAVLLALALPHLQPTMDVFIGTNGFIDDPLDKLAAVSGTLREYHPWIWDAGDGDPGFKPYPKNLVRFQPSYAAGGNAWFFDTYYGDLARRGVEVCPVIMQSPNWITKNSEAKPVLTGTDASDPKSYMAHADHLFQFASRYGRTKVPDSSLKLASGQPRVSGLGLLHYLENWNEPDKTWWGRECHFEPEELAAMCSADYDGHLGALGKTVGIKNADPSMKLVLGGLSEADTSYLNRMKVWCEKNRKGSLPFDVINVHHYANDAEHGLGSAGVSPEQNGQAEKIHRIVEWRNENAPKCEVWLSEFGYDLNPNSVQRAPAIGERTAEWVQAAWIVRAYLLLSEARVDRAQQYMFRDVNPSDKTQFSSSGLVGPKGDWSPKLSFRAVARFREALKGTRFLKRISDSGAALVVLRFVGGGKTVDAVWLPTSRDIHLPWPSTESGKAWIDLLGESPHSGVPKVVTEMPVLVVQK